MENFRIYLTNLGKYNEGYLIGEWVDLPASEEELEKAFKRIGINEEYEEFFITDYENDYCYEVGEYENLDTLNDIAETLTSLDEEQETVIKGLFEAGYTFEQALEVAQNGNYNIYYDCNDMSDVAYEIVESSCLLDGMPENLKCYFNYVAYGRDLDLEGEFWFLGNSTYLEVYR